MSFAGFSYLNSQGPPGEKIKIKGGTTEGYVVKSKDNITVNKYTPNTRKGSEYARQYRIEEDKEYNESVVERAGGSGSGDTGPSQLYELEEFTSVGTVANVRDLTQEQDTSVYYNYDFQPVQPTDHLKPIHNEKEQILHMIESNAVSIITGPTGCGKSTQIPQFILDMYAEKRQYCNIIVTQPRRMAAITLAQHVCEQRKWTIGGVVGYQVALERETNEDTRLLYCTTGVFVEKMINEQSLDKYTHILLDEVHEREEDMDFAMLIVKRFMRKAPKNQHVKVILMSATMNVTRFGEYFPVCTGNKFECAPYHEIIRENKFKVNVYYLDDLKDLMPNVPTIMDFNEPTIAQELYKMVALMIQHFNIIDDDDFVKKRSLEKRSAVLIFLPGLYQIETLHEILDQADKNHPGNKLNLWLCPLHSSITRSEQEKVRKYAPEGKRKVILSTNIAESSITIPDVKYVIDFCLTKHLVADPDTGFTSLQLAWASHTNCIQREGRVGRVQDGRVYRLVWKVFYMNEMPRECVPEMQRCPLEMIVLKCKKLIESECPLRLISSALDPPDLSNYEKTILKLKEIGALLKTCRGKIDPRDGDLTFIGRVMGSLPLDIHITKLIMLGDVFDVLEEAIIMGCAMSVRNIFSEPFKMKLEAYNNKLLWADSSESDSIAFLNAYTVWRQLRTLGKFQRSKSSEETWARRYMLQINHLKEVAKQEDDIKKRLRHFNIQVLRFKDKPLWSSMEKPLILKLVLAGAFYPHYFSRKPHNCNAEYDAVKMLGGKSPYNSVLVQNMPTPVIIYEEQVKQFLRRYKIGDDMTVSTDDTRKAVITFNAENLQSREIVGDKSLQSKIPGDVLLPVYRACKLAQLKIPIIISPYMKHEIPKEIENYQKLKSEDQNCCSLNPVIPLNQQLVEMSVCHIVDAGHFYGHIHPVEEQTHIIHSIINNPNNLRPINEMPSVNMVCVAPYKDEGVNETLFYRCKVKAVNIYQGRLTCDVFFIDFGNTERCFPEDLRMVVEHKQEELNKLPPLATECVLAEVCPNLWNSQGGCWSDEATRYVYNKIFNKNVFAKVYSYVNGVASVEIYLYDNRKASDKEPPTINSKLIKLKLASHRQESYLSKENNIRRQEAALSEDTGSLKEEILTSKMSTLSLSVLAQSGPSGYRERVALRGPTSPLEMRLYSLTHCSTQRRVFVDGSSVNSVLLDTDPSDPHERILIAGSIKQSAEGGSLSLNHTTVLPNMHGLAALVCLIFTPCAELRTDSCFSRFTGMICGLGMNEDGSSLFPENDIEMPFDIEISVKDLLSINKLRFWMNLRYSYDEAEDLADATIADIQKNIRSLILDLLKKDWPAIKVSYNSKPHVWGLIPKNRQMLAYDREDYQDIEEKFIYPLHLGINLLPDNDRREIEQVLNKLKAMEQCLHNKVTPAEIVCPLCDQDFDYVKLLQMHTNSTHHQDLRRWLLARAEAHGLK